MAFAPQSQGRPTPSPISPIGQRPKPPNKGPLGDLSLFYSNKKAEDQKDDQRDCHLIMTQLIYLGDVVLPVFVTFALAPPS